MRRWGQAARPLPSRRLMESRKQFFLEIEKWVSDRNYILIGKYSIGKMGFADTVLGRRAPAVPRYIRANNRDGNRVYDFFKENDQWKRGEPTKRAYMSNGKRRPFSCSFGGATSFVLHAQHE